MKSSRSRLSMRTPRKLADQFQWWVAGWKRVRYERGTRLAWQHLGSTLGQRIYANQGLNARPPTGNR